jgi:hypothetical protein
MLGELGSVTATRRQPVEIQAEWLTASEFGDEAFVLVTQLQKASYNTAQPQRQRQRPQIGPPVFVAAKKAICAAAQSATTDKGNI